MKDTLFLLLTFCTLTWCERQGRIVGGQAAERGQFPWQTLVVAKSGGQVISYCGGALISKDYVLTAAQCVDGAQRLDVWLGAHNISRTPEPNRVILTSESWTMHENYSDTTYDNDIAIVRLPRAMFQTAYIGYVRVPSGDDALSDYMDWSASISGWGFIRDGYNRMTDVLTYSYNTVVNPNLCVTNFGAEWMNANKMCVATTGARGPCYGDAGGPLVVQNEDASFTLIGLFSFLDTVSCQQGKPVGFTRVGAYIDWLKEMAGFVPV